LGFAAILFLVTQITNREFSLRSESYRLQAQFENVGGLKAGAPVSMAGVTIGRVESIGYDMNLFKAVVTLRIDSSYDQIPNDSDASILTPDCSAASTSESRRAARTNRSATATASNSCRTRSCSRT